MLEQLGIEYMVTGSYASSTHGSPRMTHDVDLVVAFDARHIPAFLEAFPPPEFYLSDEAMRDAVRSGRMFNVMEMSRGDKIDFWMLTDEPFDRSRFARRREETPLGLPVQMSSPEDTILAKLRWAKLSGGSEKQTTDVRLILEAQRAALDYAYLDQWAQELGVSEAWQRMVEEDNSSH